MYVHLISDLFPSITTKVVIRLHFNVQKMSPMHREIKTLYDVTLASIISDQGRSQEFDQGGLKFFFFPGGFSTRWGLKTP